jgi:hypothetical protein
VSSFYLPHYLAPALPPLLVLYAACCGLVVRLKPGRRLARGFVGAFTLVLGALYVWRMFEYTALERGSQSPEYWTRQRQAIANQLDSIPGKDVVFVRYASTYKSQNEWVQNGADLAATSVLWVHDLGDEANAELGRWEANRRTWLVTVHGMKAAPELTPYELPLLPLGDGTWIHSTR